jgi:aspartate kinase
MSRIDELRELLDAVCRRPRGAELYNRIFVVSAFGGITDLLLEHKKSGAPGVCGLCQRRQRPRLARPRSTRWPDAMCEAHGRCSTIAGDIERGRRLRARPDRGARNPA